MTFKARHTYLMGNVLKIDPPIIKRNIINLHTNMEQNNDKTTVRAKFSCTDLTNHEDGSQTANFAAVISGSEENEKFFKFTPGGSLSLYYANPSIKFKIGKEYYIDISEASI